MKKLHYFVIFLIIYSGIDVLITGKTYISLERLPLLPSILTAGLLFYGAYVIWKELISEE